MGHVWIAKDTYMHTAIHTYTFHIRVYMHTHAKSQNIHSTKPSVLRMMAKTASGACLGRVALGMEDLCLGTRLM